MKLTEFINDLASVELPEVFNPYSDYCDTHDLRDAAKIRRSNLLRYLESFESSGVRSMWIGRDLGYRGGRRTGIPLTDEVRLDMLNQSMAGSEVRRATTGEPMGERTATEIWKVISQLSELPLMWNVFPLHPHEPTVPFSNRAHTAKERRHLDWVLEKLVEWANPDVVIGIGRDAFKAISAMGGNCLYVRHPSYGGQSEFLSGMRSAYG